MTEEQSNGKQILSIIIFFTVAAHLLFKLIPGEQMILMTFRVVFTGIILFNLWRGKKWAKKIFIVLNIISAVGILLIFITVRQLFLLPFFLLVLFSLTVILITKHRNVNAFLQYKREQLTKQYT